MPRARKLFLVALVILFGSLFLLHTDGGSATVRITLTETEGYYHAAPQTGFELHPYAKFVIVILLVVFLTELPEEKWINRYIYWIALVLLIYFALIGAVLRVWGGRLATIGILMVAYAAWLNHKDSRPKKVTQSS